MGDGLGPVAGGANRVGIPDLGELGAASAQLRQEAGEGLIAGVSVGSGAQPRHRDMTELFRA
jgi:hypothetical protein